MSIVKFSLILLICVGAILTHQGKRKSKNFEKELTLEGDFTHEWKMWKKIYKKEYKNLAEETEKYQIWLKNVDFVNRHNLKASLGEKSFTTSLNKYADLSIDDVRKGMNGYKRELKPEWMTSSGAQQFWKPKGLVSLIKKGLSHYSPPWNYSPPLWYVYHDWGEGGYRLSDH